MTAVLCLSLLQWVFCMVTSVRWRETRSSRPSRRKNSPSWWQRMWQVTSDYFGKGGLGVGVELQSTQHRGQWQGNSEGSQNWGLWCEGQCDGEIYTYGEREKTEHIQKVETNPGFFKTRQCKTTCAFLALMLLNQQQTVTVQWQWRPWMGQENLAGFAWTFSCPSKSGLMFFRRNSW